MGIHIAPMFFVLVGEVVDGEQYARMFSSEEYRSPENINTTMVKDPASNKWVQAYYFDNPGSALRWMNNLG